jgi:Mrp family chromosome partitioning ATPase
MKGDLLFVRLQLAAPDARSYLIASPLDASANPSVAMELAAGAAARGHVTRLIHLPTGYVIAPEDAGAGYEIKRLDADAMKSPSRLRGVLDSLDGINIIAGGGIDEDAGTTIAAAAADAIVLVVRQGHTRRSDIRRIRALVELNGGRLAGSVLLR